MINLELKQTISNIKESDYQFIVNQNKKYDIKLLNITMKEQEFKIYEQGQEKYSLIYNSKEQFKSLFKSSVKYGKQSFILYDVENTKIGEICRKHNKFWGGYYFFEIKYNSKTYIMYEVCMGKNGIKLPIYCDNNQIALIEKDIEVYDNNDQYKISALDDSFIVLLLMSSLYYDFIKFNNRREVTKKKSYSYYPYSINKELLSKYDSNWKN